MRKELLIVVILSAAAACPGQVSVRTPAFSFGNPVLGVQGDFLGENGTTWLNAGAGGTLVLSVTNSGTATARGAVVTLTPAGPLKDIQIVHTDSLGDIKPGEVRTEKVPLSAPEDAESQKGILLITVRAEPGPVSSETKVDIAIREVPSPRLEFRLTEGGDAVIGGAVSKINARVRNTGTGAARGASATFLPAGPGIEPGLAETGKTVLLGTIAQGSSKEITLTLRPSAGAEGPAAFVVRLDEERGKFSVFQTISVQVRAAVAGAEQAGMAAFIRGDYNQAIASFQKVVAGGKASREVYFKLGISYFKNRNRSRCLASMQKSSGLGSSEAKAWIRENTTPVEITTVTYRQTDTDPFVGCAPPVGLGVLPFADPLNHDTPVTEKMYDALKAKNEKFRIFPFSTIKSEQASWGLTALSPSNKQILTALEKELSMNFAVAAIARDSVGSAFTMQIFRCRDGTPVLTREFRTSRTSTAIDDAAMFLLTGRVPVYGSTHVLEVKFP